MNNLTYFAELGKRAAAVRRRGPETKTIKLQPGQPSPTPDTDEKRGIQPAQHYGRRLMRQIGGFDEPAN